MFRPACVTAIAAVAIVVAAGIEQGPARTQAAPASGGPIDPALIEDLVAANRILADEGVLDLVVPEEVLAERRARWTVTLGSTLLL